MTTPYNTAPMRNKTYFVSDIHLGAVYIANPREHEAKVVRMLQSFEKDCKTLYLLGDILDYWFEYRTVVPRGYIRFFGQLAHMSDMGINIVWFIGNHDIWLFDYLRDQIGMEVIDGNVVRDIDGKNFSWDMAMHYTATVAVFAYFAAFSATAYAKNCTPAYTRAGLFRLHTDGQATVAATIPCHIPPSPTPKKSASSSLHANTMPSILTSIFLSSATGILPLTTP